MMRWILTVMVAALCVAGCSAPGSGQAAPQSPAGASSSSAPTVTTTVTVTAPETTNSTTTTTTTTTAAAAATAQGWSETVKDVRSGVVHLSVTTCDGSSVGSGALVTPNLVVTAAHVVEGAAYITLRTNGEVAEGKVVAYDPGAEIALVRSERTLNGHIFSLAPDDPPEGTAVAALGYPLDEALSVTEGIVSARDIQGRVNGHLVRNQLLTSVAVNPGNSGGPLITTDGAEVGIVSSIDLLPEDQGRAEGRSNAISASVARRAVDRLGADAEPLRLETCDFNPRPGTDDVVEVNVSSDDPRASLFGQLLGQHGQGINDGDYEGAFSMFTPAMQRRMGGLAEWSSGVRSSYWRELTIEDVSGTDTEPVIETTLRTEQAADDGYNGQTCSVFHNTYHLVAEPTSDYGWLINRAKGEPPSPCP